MEKILTVVKNGEFNNVKLTELGHGEFVMMKKIFAEGRHMPEGKFGPTYSCRTEYNGEEVSFFLKPAVHEMFKDVGGQEDTIKITATKIPFKDKQGMDRVKTEYAFDLVE